MNSPKEQSPRNKIARFLFFWEFALLLCLSTGLVGCKTAATLMGGPTRSALQFRETRYAPTSQKALVILYRPNKFAGCAAFCAVAINRTCEGLSTGCFLPVWVEPGDVSITAYKTPIFGFSCSPGDSLTRRLEANHTYYCWITVGGELGFADEAEALRELNSMDLETDFLMFDLIEQHYPNFPLRYGCSRPMLVILPPNSKVTKSDMMTVFGGKIPGSKETFADEREVAKTFAELHRTFYGPEVYPPKHSVQFQAKYGISYGGTGLWLHNAVYLFFSENNPEGRLVACLIPRITAIPKEIPLPGNK
jgi:hypothetical protein